jgi:hypothetical protein
MMRFDRCFELRRSHRRKPVPASRVVGCTVEEEVGLQRCLSSTGAVSHHGSGRRLICWYVPARSDRSASQRSIGDKNLSAEWRRLRIPVRRLRCRSGK